MSIFLADDHRLRPIWRFLLAVVFFFLSQFIAAVVASIFVRGQSDLLFDVVYRPLSLVLLVLSFLFLLTTADMVEHKRLEAQGLGRRSWLRDSGRGLALGIALVALGGVAIAVLGDFHLQVETAGQTGKFFAVLWILLAGAMAEEVAFRGYPFQRLVESVGPWFAIGILSLLFGMVHLGNPNASFFGFLNTALFGLPLSLAYLRTGSLWLPFGIHLGWNVALGTLLGLPLSGMTKLASVVRGQATGPEWLTGGSYGLEASATCTVLILLGTAAVWAMTRQPALQAAADRQKTTLQA